MKISKTSLLLFFGSLLIFSYKLSYESFFTDEIIYVKAGLEAFQGMYSLILEVPPLGKYLAGFAAMWDEYNIFLMRFPYAVLAALSCLLVYKILLLDFNKRWAILGSIVYIWAPFILDSSRMVMMEGPLLFLWLVFHLFFLKYLKAFDAKNLYIAGLAIGLSMAIKLTSIVLYPFSLVIVLLVLRGAYRLDKKHLIHVFGMYAISILSFGLTYTDLLLKTGKTGAINVARALKDRYLGKNEEGKIHVVGDLVFTFSPWWYYLYFLVHKYSFLHFAASLSTLVLPFIKRSFFNFYWLFFLIVTFGFSQLVNVKTPRYIVPFEFALVFLTTSFLKYLYETTFNTKPFGKFVFWILIIAITLSRLTYLYALVPTKYTALKNFLVQETQNFTNRNRTYIFGSIRSSRWAFDNTDTDPNFKYVVSRKDFDVMAKEFPNFKYIVFDETELLKDPNNMLYTFVMTNKQNYELVQLPGLDVYVRKD